MQKKILGILIVILIVLAIIGCLIFQNNKESEVNNEMKLQNQITNNNYDTTPREFNFDTKTVTLNSGYEMPLNGIGTYSLTGDECYNSITSALNSGVRLIDTAYMYNNEEEVGRAIRDSGIPREEIFVITKIYPSQFNNPEEAIEMALDKLDIGYIDMMLLHHPGSNDVNAYIAMEKYVQQGKIHSIGLSNWYINELEEFLPQVEITPALVQNEIHPYYQELNVVPYIQSKGIVVQGWYPFGDRGHTSELLNNKTIVEIANAHNVTSAQVILRWNLQRGVVVIPGSSNPEHIKENTEIYDFELTSEEMQKIEKLNHDGMYASANEMTNDVVNEIKTINGNENDIIENNNSINKEMDTMDSEGIKINLIVNNKTFTANLENNQTVQELIQNFPMTLNMSDLHSNEKYNYLNSSLTTNSNTPSMINAGDIKLYGNNCLVVFYDNFRNSYSYTNLGKVDNVDDFVAELESGSVNIRFELAE